MIQIVDLFCGGGGFTKGCIDAGHNPVLCVDNWEKALEFHHANFPMIPALKIELGGCIEDVAYTIESYIDRNFHFHLHGSPPCQALSTAGNKNSSEGYGLVKWFLQLVEYMKPNSWSMENVVPVAKFLDKDSIPYVKLNSADFGVPQTRKRIFAGQGWDAIKTHSQENWVSIIEALPNLEGELQENINSKIKKRTIDQPIRTITSKSPSQTRIISMGKFKIQRKIGKMNSSDRILKPIFRDFNEPINTITSRNHEFGVMENKNLQYKKIRTLTIEETAVLQGWNDCVIPKLNKTDLFVIIGNLIPPAVGKAIIKGIIQNNKIDFNNTFNSIKFKQIKLFS
jgi:DNA (cytosine-5)-methyltransferase 1